MTELVPYVASSDPVDSWSLVLADVGDLASKIAATEFVPDAMRNKPATVAACILAGREAGIGPMRSLQHIAIVKGKPTMSAELMRDRAFAAGHRIKYVKQTATEVVVEGCRNGEDNWTRVAFTAADAQRAGIDLGKYPEDKLVARATSRLCRRIFADALGGISYTPEDLEDDGPATVTRLRRAPSPAAALRLAELGVIDAELVAEDAPPLDEPPEPDAGAQSAPLTAEEQRGSDYSPDISPSPAPASAPYNGPSPSAIAKVTPKQLGMMGALFGDCGWTDRADRLRATSKIVGRDIGSANELTRNEASQLLDVLKSCADETDPGEALTRAVAS